MRFIYQETTENILLEVEEGWENTFCTVIQAKRPFSKVVNGEKMQLVSDILTKKQLKLKNKKVVPQRNNPWKQNCLQFQT